MSRKELNIVSVSGGKDSTALYLLAQQYYGNNFFPIFADTGHEHPVTINYVKNLNHLAKGPTVQIVKADFEAKLQKKGKQSTGNAFLDLMLWKGRAPSTKAQFCTEHLKLWPIFFYLERNYPSARFEWIMHTGIRAAESLRRSKRHPFEWNHFFNCQSILPLLYESERTIFGLLESHGVPPNPLYAYGFGRVGCFPCIHSNKRELRNLPEWAWNRLRDYENAVGRTWFPPDILPKRFRTKGELPTIDQVKEWCKTVRGGSQYDLFTSEIENAPSCVTGFIHCE